MGARKRSICIVAIGLDYITRNGGIGTYNWLLAHVLAREGWQVHILYCGPVDDNHARTSVPRRLADAGIGFHSLDQFPVPRNLKVYTLGEPGYVFRSDRVRYALEELHHTYRFDLIEFAEFEALGFRPIQAKMSGLAFQDVLIAVKLHSPSRWIREGSLYWMEEGDNLRLDFCERYSFENADLQLGPCRYILDYARSNGWKVRRDAQIVRYPFPEPSASRQAEQDGSVEEVVFFGRLETRKGLEIFVEAAKYLDPSIPLTFLGKDTQLVNGPLASKYIKTQLKDRKTSVLTNLNREQAISYLARGNRLAVIPSLAETGPYTIVECAVNGIPFLASSAGGAPEIIWEADLQANLLFEPSAPDLLRCLRSYLQADPSHRREINQKVREAADVQASNRHVTEAYSHLLLTRDTQCVVSLAAKADDPLVTVCVTFYNLGRYLPETLASLASQTYCNVEVLVIDDGSTDPDSIRVFLNQQQLYPQFRFLRQCNTGLGAARNRGMAEAKGEYFVPMDADNIATPQMVERFVAGIRRRPGLSALACYYLAFTDSTDIACGKFYYAVRPAGGSHVMASLENVYGDATAIYRLADFLAIGGYETDRDTTCEDWEAFVKLVNAGYKVDVLPEYLFYYRHRTDSLLRTTNDYRNRQRVLRHYFCIEDLPQAERVELWTALVSLNLRIEERHHDALILRYEIVDRVIAVLEKLPFLYRSARWLAVAVWRKWRRVSFVRQARRWRLSKQTSV